MKQSLEQDERDERSGVPQACCLELDHGLSLERGKRWFTDLFQIPAFELKLAIRLVFFFSWMA